MHAVYISQNKMCLKYSKIDNFLQLNGQIFVFEAKNGPFTTSLKKNTANLRTNPKKGGGSNPWTPTMDQPLK
jgi:hypothetical protein